MSDSLSAAAQDKLICQRIKTEWDVLGNEVSLGAQILGLWSFKRSCEVTRLFHDQVIAALQAEIDRQWPEKGLKLQSFGSTQNGLGLLSSDLDLVLIDPSLPGGRWTPKQDRNLSDEPLDHGLPEWYNVNTLADALARCSEVSKITPISSARVPIVKLSFACCACGEAPLEVDISVNNLFCLANTRLIRSYVALRPDTVPALFFAVKYWLKAQGFNDPSGRFSSSKSLSSYAIALLVLQFLQRFDELPTLQNEVLLSLLPSSEKALLYNRMDVRQPTLNDPQAKKHSDTSWDMTFIDLSPDSPHLLHVELKRHARRRIIAPINRRLPGSLQMSSQWQKSLAAASDSVRPGDRCLDRDIGLHKGEPSNQRDLCFSLGTLFIHFLRWLDGVLNFGKVVDAARGSDRHQNTDEDEHLYRRWIESPAKCSSARPAYNPDDPIDWQRDKLVIVDPFIRHQNVARNITDATKIALLKEVRRVREDLARKGSDSTFAGIVAL